MYQATQCINCGGYKVTESIQRWDPLTGQDPGRYLTQTSYPRGLESWLIRLTWLGPILYIVLLVAFTVVAIVISHSRRGVFIAIDWVMSTLVDIFGNLYVMGAIIIAFIVTGFFTNVLFRRRTKARAQGLWQESEARAVSIHSYYCNICGRQWTWREDQPRPIGPSSPHANLLEMGARRLEEEQRELERRRQQVELDKQHAAAADAWQRHLRGEI